MRIISLYILSILCLSFATLQAAPSKPFFKSEEEADIYLSKHYQLGCQAYNCQNWRRASAEFEKVIYFFPCSETAAEVSYYLAVCYFEMKEYDFANAEFSSYLKASHHPAFFEDAVYYKFCIAEHFRAGTKKRPFKMRYLPKWVSGYDLALTIYDEIVAALPTHELSIQALMSKGDLLKKMGEFRESIETYQLMIRRFPKHEVVPICYLKIADTYFQQSRYEFQNPDILALAELNVRKFKDEFPQDERIDFAEQSIRRIKEMYAKGLCDLGLFYERMNQPDAAAIYFQSSIEEFPDTQVSQFCYSRLVCLGYAYEKEFDEYGNEQMLDVSITEEAPPRFSAPLEYDEEQKEPFEVQPFVEEQEPSYECSEEIPSQDYYHYSLRKKKQISHAPYEPIEVDQGPYPADGCHEENRAQGGEIDPDLDENAPYFLHYSQLKHRDQYGAPQNQK